MLWVGVDVGGTFTDVVVYDETSGALEVGKAPTNPVDPSVGFLNAFDKLKLDLTRTGRVVHGTTIGTAAYMAPEQARGNELTAATDLYAVGVVLFETTTGRLPFAHDNPMATLLAQIQTPPPRPSDVAPKAQIVPALEGLILRALAKDEVFFELKDEVSPGVFKTLESFVCVIMPVRLS